MTEEAKAALLSDSYSREELALKRGVSIKTLKNLLCQARDKVVIGIGERQRIDKAWAEVWLKKESKKFK